MSSIFFQHVSGILRPHSLVTADAIADLSQFEVVRVKIYRGRNERFNALYWALLGYVAKALEATGEEWTKDDIHKEIKTHLGLYKVKEMPEHIVRLTGRTHELEYLSTDFNSMTETAFREFAMKAVGIIEEHICPYLKESEEAARVDKIVAEFRK